jgi:hypothetical protein
LLGINTAMGDDENEVAEPIDYEGNRRQRFQLLRETMVTVGCYAVGAGTASSTLFAD